VHLVGLIYVNTPEGYIKLKLMKLNFITACLDLVSVVSSGLNDTRFDSTIIYNLTVKD